MAALHWQGARLNSESSRAGVLPNKKSHSVERLKTFDRSQDSTSRIASKVRAA